MELDKKFIYAEKEVVVLQEEVKPEHCPSHLRFRKSCPACKARPGLYG